MKHFLISVEIKLESAEWLQNIFEQLSMHYCLCEFKKNVLKWHMTQEEFFYSWIDTLIDKDSCKDLQIPLAITHWDKKIHKHDISLSETLESLGNRWLFVVFFSNKEDRYFNEKVQKPMLFWITNAHTTMKVGTNWEAFFFVNDFSNFQ